MRSICHSCLEDVYVGSFQPYVTVNLCVSYSLPFVVEGSRDFMLVRGGGWIR
jgi:hypothetical protein